MKVTIRLELRLDVGEHVFRYDEVIRDVVRFPYGPLCAHWTVRAAANQEPIPYDHSHHVHREDSWRIAHFESSVYVKAYEYHRLGSSFLQIVSTRWQANGRCERMDIVVIERPGGFSLELRSIPYSCRPAAWGLRRLRSRVSRP